MKHLPTILVALFLSSSAANVAACEPAPPSARGSDAIFVGYVTGERWPDLEAEYAGGAKASTIGNARGYPMLLLRVVQTERLKGNAPHIVEAVSPCALPIKAGERVVVSHSSGGYGVYPAAMVGGEQAIRKALRKNR